MWVGVYVNTFFFLLYVSGLKGRRGKREYSNVVVDSAFFVLAKKPLELKKSFAKVKMI